MPSPSIPTATVAGFPIAVLDKVGFERAAREIVQSNGACWIVTLNLEMVSRCRLDREYRDLLRTADLFIADGMPLVWASKLKRGIPPLPERLNGSEMTEVLLRLVPASNVAILGGVDPAAALEKISLAERESVWIFKDRVDASPESAKRFADELKSRGSKVVFLALGVPKQDRMAKLLRDQLPSGILMGVGGTFELIAGQVKRAPDWMRNSGLEWLFRLIQEPRRLAKRYLVLYWVGGFALAGDIVRSWFRKSG